MLEHEFKFFLENKEELLKAHLGKFLIIKNNAILDIYDSEAEAYASTLRNGNLGSVLIQQCLPSQSSYSQYFHSRVVF